MMEPFKPGRLIDRPELQIAAAWWRKLISQPQPHDNGEFTGSFLATAAATTLKPLTEAQLIQFESELKIKMARTYAKDWREEQPHWGGYFRVLAVDYSPEGILREAAVAAGIDRLMIRFPCKTLMWVDPGSVRVQNGYGAPEKTLYPVPEAESIG